MKKTRTSVILFFEINATAKLCVKISLVNFHFFLNLLEFILFTIHLFLLLLGESSHIG